MAEIQDNSSQYLTFSQRHGYEPLPEPMRLEFLSDDIRRELCNIVYELLFVEDSILKCDKIRFFVRVLGRFFKQTEDEMRTSPVDIYEILKRHLPNDTFNCALDLIELIVNDTGAGRTLVEKIQLLFEQHSAAYYLDLSQQPYMFHPRCSKEQGIATIKAINTIQENGKVASANHLRQAAVHINAQQYGDAIVDSIHAVESVARSIDKKASSLGQALKNLEKQGLKLHPALREGFEKLYGYTSDEQGIRHAQIDKDSPEVGLDEAMFMFGACASFAAFLVSKHKKFNSGS